ncbi:alpha/beta hydrolase [Sporobolomyces salmoneus]|uniref:alpha/beta hydrolase n=1 Tax=Sporobolomyces salmoneus TaxID=183962 RepID=UPI00317916CE
MVPPLAPAPPPPNPPSLRPFDSPRISIDQEEEENAGLLRSYHSAQGEDYPPPLSPPSLIFLSASAFNHYSPILSTSSTNDYGWIREKMHEEPRVGLDETKIRVQQSKLGDYTVSAILLYGLGQPNHELPFVRKMAAKFPYVRWVSPTADQLNVTVRNFEPTNAWFNIETFDDLSKGENIDEFIHSQQQLNKLVDEEKEKMRRDGKEPRIALMGFSQGAVMTMLSLLTANETKRFEAGIALSGYVPLLDSIDQIASPKSREIPLFWGHGALDPYLTIEQARAGSNLLGSSGMGLRNFQFKEYEGLDHIWNERELDDVVEWFRRTVPSGRKFGRPNRKPSPSQTASASDQTPSRVDQEATKWEKVLELDNAAEAK